MTDETEETDLFYQLNFVIRTDDSDAITERGLINRDLGYLINIAETVFQQFYSDPIFVIKRNIIGRDDIVESKVCYKSENVKSLEYFISIL